MSEQKQPYIADKMYYTAAEVCAMFRPPISRQVLAYYQRCGEIAPAIKRGTHRQSKVLYSAPDVLRLLITRGQVHK